jgi:DNA-directed RNA polymerase specialized sigma24 family protein
VLRPKRTSCWVHGSSGGVCRGDHLKDLTIIDIDPAVHGALLATIPQLRAFAISLCRNSEQADDLVQDTLPRAYSHIAGFQPGTNMAGWLSRSWAINSIPRALQAATRRLFAGVRISR